MLERQQETERVTARFAQMEHVMAFIMARVNESESCATAVAQMQGNLEGFSRNLRRNEEALQAVGQTLGQHAQHLNNHEQAFQACEENQNGLTTSILAQQNVLNHYGSQLGSQAQQVQQLDHNTSTAIQTQQMSLVHLEAEANKRQFHARQTLRQQGRAIGNMREELLRCQEVIRAQEAGASDPVVQGQQVSWRDPVVEGEQEQQVLWRDPVVEGEQGQQDSASFLGAGGAGSSASALLHPSGVRTPRRQRSEELGSENGDGAMSSSANACRRLASRGIAVGARPGTGD